MDGLFYFSFDDLTSFLWKLISGFIGVILGYFSPIKDIVHWLVLLFIVDMIFGYLAAKKLRQEKFSKKIVFSTTIPRMLASIILILLLYSWDLTFKQTYLATYNVAGWFIGGILIISVGKNLFSITNWRVIPLIGAVIQKRIEKETGVEIPDNN